MTWLTATEALKVLGVRPQTLYANVSRKKIRAKPDPKDTRRSLYHEVDVRKFARQHGGRRKATLVAAGAIEWGDPIMPSAISTVSEGRLYYRGKDAVTLSETATLEEVAGVLWGAEGVDFAAAADLWASTEVAPAGVAESTTPLQRAFLTLGRRAGTDVSSYGRSLSVLQSEAAGVLLTLVDAMLEPAVAAVSTAGSGAPRRAKTAAATTAIARAPTRASGAQRRSASGRVAATSTRGDDRLHMRIASALGRPEAADLIRRVLVLLADHELNASTFATRVAVSTGAPLSAGILSGLATLSGPLHGRASLGVLELISTVERHGAEQGVRDWLSQGRFVAGFGHPLYPSGDPRATALLTHLALPREYAELRDVVEDVIGEHPNIDYALAALTKVHRLPQEAPLILFALGRCVGWLAHALEQVTTGHPIRPRARYIGPPLT